ncbi:MAG TPA: Ger(x)C family spore germination protein [Selenomonadales bacterium]|nr:Ger(x)C family spore germination protein [Selenomonadales bacterium]
MRIYPENHGNGRRAARRLAAFAALTVLAIFTAGCWDRVEIQDRGMVKSMAVDVVEADPDPPATQRVEDFVQPHGPKQFMLTLEVVRLAGGQRQSSGTSESQTFTISSHGRSLHEMKRDMLGQLSKNLDFGHMDAVIFSEAALKQEGLRPLMDNFLRDPSIRWRMRIYVTSGTARSILEYKTPTGEPLGQFLASLMTNQSRSTHMPAARTDMGYITIALDNGGDVYLPRIEVAEKALKVGGGAAFHKDKFIGYVDEPTVQGWRLARGLQKAASITIPCEEHPENLAVMEITNSSATMEPHVDGDNIYFTVEYQASGNLAEFQCINEHGKVEPQDIHKLEKRFAQELTRSIAASLHTMQVLNFDPSGVIAEKLKSREHATWLKIKDRWPEIYPTIPFYVHASVTLQNIGEHR